jgi:multidrug efflux pump subunit AcrA (membrane-fusion protein)
MNRIPNEPTGAEDVYPDISAIFNVDEKRAAGKPVEKTTDAPRKSERILTSEEGLRHLPKEERKKMKADARKKKRAETVRRLKTRAIVVLSVVLVALVAGLVIWARIAEAKKPEVSVAKATVETVERSYSGTAVIVADGNGVAAVLIDNDYDVHYIARNLPAVLKNSSGAEIPGRVTEIREEKPGTDSFSAITAALQGEIPEVPVYTVRIAPEPTEQILTPGEKLTARVITETAENAVAVPTQAVLMDGAQPYVWIFHSFTKKLTRQDIAIGISSDEKTEVLRGLKKGDRVVSGSKVPSSELYEGVKVKMRQGSDDRQ